MLLRELCPSLAVARATAMRVSVNTDAMQFVMTCCHDVFAATKVAKMLIAETVISASPEEEIRVSGLRSRVAQMRANAKAKRLAKKAAYVAAEQRRKASKVRVLRGHVALISTAVSSAAVNGVTANVRCSITSRLTSAWNSFNVAVRRMSSGIEIVAAKFFKGAVIASSADLPEEILVESRQSTAQLFWAESNGLSGYYNSQGELKILAI